MRAFRYGGVNVTYFLPKSPIKMNSPFYGSQNDRLFLPSVRLLFFLNLKTKLFISSVQFEKKALADALQLYMRAIMSLDDRTRAKIIDSDSVDDNFDHLKIDCRAQGKQRSHESFGEQLFHTMKSVNQIIKTKEFIHLNFL